MRTKTENDNRAKTTERAKESYITGQARRDESPINYPSCDDDRENHAAIYGRPGEFLMD